MSRDNRQRLMNRLYSRTCTVGNIILSVIVSSKKLIVGDETYSRK